MGIDELDVAAARTQVRARFSDADEEGLLLLEDLLGIADTELALSDVAADARRRRLAALINAAALAQTSRRSISSRMCIGSMRPASRCWPR